MVTKKTTQKRITSRVLKFDPDWIRDPVPPFFKNLDRAAIRELNQAKREFQARVKDILKRGQQ